MTKGTPRTDSSRSENASPRQISPYAFTKTGVAGEHRESILHSELLRLPELGKVRRRGHKIPPPNFIYGVGSPRWDGGVPAALQYTPERDRPSNPDFEFVRDYEALNKAALEAGMLTARDQGQYRSLHDIKRKVYIRDVSLAKNTLKLPDDMIFGTPYRPGTPIEEVLRHSYGDKWLESLQNRQASIKKDKIDNAQASQARYHTKTSLLRQAKIPVDSKPLWKLPKFNNVEHQIDSFRSDKERRKALKANSADDITRLGVYHTGIYDVPRTTVKT